MALGPDFLIQRPGAQTSDGGLLTVLSGNNPTGFNKNARLGLDYYNGVDDKKHDLSFFMINGDKGVYNALKLAQMRQEEINKLLAEDKKALAQYQGKVKVYESLVNQGNYIPVTTQVQTGTDANGVPIFTNKVDMQYAGPLNVPLPNMPALHDMPAFTSYESIKSGDAQKLSYANTRKSIGKPAAYGTPVFNLLSGAAPNNSLLGG